MNCKNFDSGCNAPEGECMGLCMPDGKYEAPALNGASEIESLRGKLAEVTRDRDRLKNVIEQRTFFLNDTHEQLLATQAHAARLAQALEMIFDKWENGPDVFEDVEELSGPMGKAVDLSGEEENQILALIPSVLNENSTPINLDALHEDRARECERLAADVERNWINIARWLRKEAAAHRARKEQK